jgi:hypothetical protein
MFLFADNLLVPCGVYSRLLIFYWLPGPMWSIFPFADILLAARSHVEYIPVCWYSIGCQVPCGVYSRLLTFYCLPGPMWSIFPFADILLAARSHVEYIPVCWHSIGCQVPCGVYSRLLTFYWLPGPMWSIFPFADILLATRCQTSTAHMSGRRAKCCSCCSPWEGKYIATTESATRWARSLGAYTLYIKQYIVYKVIWGTFLSYSYSFIIYSKMKYYVVLLKPFGPTTGLWNILKHIQTYLKHNETYLKLIETFRPNHRAMKHYETYSNISET